MPASGRFAPPGISGRSALVACGQLAGAAAWVSTPLDFDAAGAAPHYRRCMSDGSNYLDPNRPDGAKAIRTLSPVLKRSAAGRAGVPWSAVFARFEIAADQVNRLFRHEDQVRHLRVRAPRERQ